MENMNYPVIIKIVYTDGRQAELLLANSEAELGQLIATATSSNSEASSYTVFEFKVRMEMQRKWVEAPYAKS